MPTNAIKKQLHLYFGSNGTLLDRQGDLSANAQDDETFVINAYIEDGVVDNQTTLINFTPQDTMAYTSDWFAMFYRELVSYVVPTESEPRVFAKFSITVPSIILLVKSGKEQFTQRITIIQRYGNTHLGNFETLAQLNIDFPPTQALDENNDVAFVYSNEVGQSNQVGFYQVEYIGGNHVWVKKESILYNLATKQFNFLGLTVNVGFSNPRGVPTVAQSTIYQLMQELNSQAVRLQIVEDDLQIAQNDIVDLQDQIDEIVDGTTDIAFDNAGTDLNSTFVEEAIKEVNDKANANEQNIVDMKNGTDAFTEVAIGVEPNVARIRYIHTNGNNYQVLQVEYPDGRKEEINETIPVNYRNESGVSLSSGRLLMTDGTSQGNQAVKGILFDPTSPNAYKVLGVVTVDGVAVNAKSKATRFGIVHDIPTSEFASSGTAYAEGQYLWGVASGRLSNVAPTKPALRVQVGIIINLQGGKADVLVAPVIYQKISDASDTRIGINESGTMLVNGDILRYQTSTQTWANSNALVLVEIEINNIKNGTTTVKKAEQDKNGNDIVNTYETKTIVSGMNSLISSLDLSKLNKNFTTLIEEVSLSLSDVFVVDKGSGARKVSLGTLASYLSTEELQLFTIVDELPNENQNPNTIYLLVTENEEGQNQLLEYIWIENQERWELIGNLEVDLSNYYTKTEANDLFNNKVDKNNAITAGTKTKITYDAKGLVTGGADLAESDIPPLSASKITQTSTARFVTDTEKSTWNGKQNALTAGVGISISGGNVISATGGLTVETWNTANLILPLSASNKLLNCSHTATQILTIPTNATVAFPIGTMVTFLLTSTFKVTFNGASGVTLTSMDGLVELATQYGMASLIKIDTDTWQLVGALE